MSAVVKTDEGRGMLRILLTGAASTAAAGLGSIANPEGVALVITRCFIYYRTGSTGAANLSIGVTTAAASATDVANAQDVIQATVGGKVIHEGAVQVAKTENPTAIWTATKYLTFTGSASTVGLDADVYVEYTRLA